jgi:predicted ArsR family transcriptional regulator
MARDNRKLTELQELVLWVVRDYGPVTPADVRRHLGYRISEASARGVLSRLEWRGLVGATYTQRDSRGRAYVATD